MAAYLRFSLLRLNPNRRENGVSHALCHESQHSGREVQRGGPRRERGKKLQQILDDTKPEAVYFWEEDGKRGGIMVVNLEKASQIPAFAEPWFLSFDASVAFHPCMTPQDLAAAGLDALGKKYAR